MLPNSATPARITATTASATNSAATIPTTHRGTVNVPFERSSPSQSRLIHVSPPHQSGGSMAQRGPPRYPKSYGGKDLVGAARPDGRPLRGIRPPSPAQYLLSSFTTHRSIRPAARI